MGVLGGFLLRVGVEMTASRAGDLLLAAAAGSVDPRATLLARLWLLSAVLVTLGAAAAAYALVRENRMLWMLVAMACVAVPLLAP
ncbi:MAG: hypothetical protein E6H00_14195 [Bacillati bacterium ANGP1]|uniref:Uncharacterized protein n=1 Tax=Candidatus Segetimicrobium genomatis TaxID=2569760 RepID=A0A537JXD2_9BACT|nr:MAG: hypothetical protein E6H00_14195 [Terrabacteria group bacterium ANGP1]